MKTKFPLLIFSVLFGTAQLFAQDQFTLAKEGQMAPDFTYETSDGTRHKLSELKGKVVWITFFATWCGPCRKELPHLQKDVYEKFGTRDDFELLVFGREHSKEELAKFKADKNFNLPFYPDAKRKIFDQFARQNIPRNFIIDKEGKIAISSVGFNEDKFRQHIQKMEALLTK
ncbi:Peroxiredoxin [Mariniphaga anaerophila]|uniref:Peroxiredoxin n=1 Tax=Mariniphaga anaerophila TaxID=1484053 RepID=A0A1M5AKC4_9BACT|nr:TlpA disulfide reductase family protein [Mariniphaga anaerophila]SHF30750.1 Peroxiredoxin [Mariniphaga anaerophila]